MHTHMPESAVIFRHFAKMLRGEFKTLDACFARQHQRCIVKAASFDVFLSTNSDGTLQVDNACIEANYEIIHDLCVQTGFKIPTTLQLGRSLARLDTVNKFALSRTSSRNAHMVWVQYESEKIHHVLSSLIRRCARSRTSKHHKLNTLKGIYWTLRDSVMDSPKSQCHIPTLEQHLQSLGKTAPADDVFSLV